MVVELWKSGDLKLCWKISLPKHALITTIYLYYILYVFITCLYVMFYQSSTLSLLWVYMCNFTICVISVCPSRAHNWNKIYLIWFDLYRPLVRATWWFIGIETLLNETESQVRITLSHDYHVTCNLSANEWIDKLPIIM